MIIYLTYNDLPSGIFSSQVIDVVNFYNQKLNTKVKLVSLISFRQFFKNKKKIIQECPTAIVIPMFPGVHRWVLNYWLLACIFWILNPEKIIGRSVLATKLAMKFQNKNCKIIYDGRGAIAAEWNEYNVVSSDYLKNNILEWEKDVVLKSDFRIAVSNQLLEYWHTQFKYNSKNHVVIPCTLNHIYDQIYITDKSISDSRKLLGLNKGDTVFAYSGSLAGWQSFDLLYNFVSPILKSNFHNKILFLSDIDANIHKLQNEFSNQVVCKKVKPSEVPNYLIAADYGLLIREESITNKVASPVKFAEYLACGLKIIISDNLGDYSQYVLDHKCGFLMSQKINENTMADKLNNNILSRMFHKQYFTNYYSCVLK